MKVRTGFVSNSSSSSYVIVGTTNKEVLEQMVRIDKPNEEEGWGGACEGKKGIFTYIMPDFELWAGGWDVETLLMKKTGKQLIDEFAADLKKRKVKFAKKDIELLIGETSSG